MFITKYRKLENKDGVFYQVVFNQTPFYAEGGGQVGDKGYIESEEGQFEVLDTKKENNLNISLIKDLPQAPEKEFTAVVDSRLRRNTQANHSATHLLHEALREVLGTHVEQKGSFVGADYLRFDFSHFSKMSDEEIALVEEK